MKKLITVLILGLFITVGSAQTNQLNIYLGPGFSYGLGGMMNVDYEIPMLDDNLTIGPSIGLGLRKYHYFTEGYGTVHHQYMVINPAVVGHYYFDWLIPDMDDRFDLFAKAKIGWYLTNARDARGYYSPLDLTIQAGGRYHFSSSASFYLALGYAYSPINLGVTIQL